MSIVPIIPTKLMNSQNQMEGVTSQESNNGTEKVSGIYEEGSQTESVSSIQTDQEINSLDSAISQESIGTIIQNTKNIKEEEPTTATGEIPEEQRLPKETVTELTGFGDDEEKNFIINIGKKN